MFAQTTTDGNFLQFANVQCVRLPSFLVIFALMIRARAPLFLSDVSWGTKGEDGTSPDRSGVQYTGPDAIVVVARPIRTEDIDATYNEALKQIFKKEQTEEPAKQNVEDCDPKALREQQEQDYYRSFRTQ